MPLAGYRPRTTLSHPWKPSSGLHPPPLASSTTRNASLIHLEARRAAPRVYGGVWKGRVARVVSDRFMERLPPFFSFSTARLTNDLRIDECLEVYGKTVAWGRSYFPRHPGIFVFISPPPPPRPRRSFLFRLCPPFESNRYRFLVPAARRRPRLIALRTIDRTDSSRRNERKYRPGKLLISTASTFIFFPPFSPLPPLRSSPPLYPETDWRLRPEFDAKKH